MKISNFNLKNFKSFGNVDNRFDNLQDINYIHGENNSGKSNVLKFLKLIFDSKLDVSEQIDVEGEEITTTSDSKFYNGVIVNKPYIFHNNNKDAPIEFDFVLTLSHNEIENAGFDFFEELKGGFFVKNRSEAHLEFHGKIKSISNQESFISISTVKFNKKDVYKATDDTEEFFGAPSGTGTLEGNRLAFNSLLTYLNDIVVYIDNDRYFGKEILSNSTEKKLVAGNFKNWLYSLSLNEFKYQEYLELLDFVRKYEIGCLEVLKELSLSFSKNEEGTLEILLDNGNQRLPIDSFGTGVNQIFYILAILCTTDARIVLIEELELNLSPKTQKELLNILRQLIEDKRIDQVFFTSHSDYFDFRNDIALFKTSICEGTSRVERKKHPSKSIYIRG